MQFFKRDPHSRIVVSQDIDFFDTPKTVSGNAKTTWVKFKPINSINDPPYTFNIPESQAFYDWKYHYIYTTWKAFIQDNLAAAERDLIDTDEVSLIQGFGDNWIRNLIVSLAGRQVFRDNYYAHKNYINTILSYTPDAKLSHLAMTGFYPDGLDPLQLGVNNSFRKRRDLITNGKEAEFIGKLNVPIFNTDKMLLNNMPVTIEINPHTPEFLFMAPTLPQAARLRIQLTELSLYIKRRELTDSLGFSIARALRDPGRTANYQVRHTECKQIYLAQGVTFMDQTISTGPCPRKIVIAKINRDNFDGRIRTNPFWAEHFDEKAIKITENGEEVPHVSYNLDYRTRAMGNYQTKFLRAYYDFQENCGFAFSPLSNGITLDMYKTGYNFHVFNLTRSLEDHREFDVVVHGTTSLRLDFNEPIPAPGISVFVYMEFDQLIKIDNDRVVTTDLMS